MQDQKIHTNEPVTPETQKKIDAVLEKVKQHIEKSGLRLEPLNDGSGYCGTYILNCYPAANFPNGNGTVVKLRITDSYNKKINTEASISLSESEMPKLEKSITELLQNKYKLFHYNSHKSNLAEFDDKKLGFFIRRELQIATDKDPEDFSFDHPSSTANYICNIGEVFPTGNRTTIDFFIPLRNARDIDVEHMAKNHIKKPFEIKFSSGTNDLKEFEILKNRVKNVLKSNSIVEHNLSDIGVPSSNKTLSKELINLENVSLIEENHKDGSKTYKVLLVAQDNKKRQPAITKRLGNISKEEGVKVVDYLKYELLPAYLSGEHKDDPLTLGAITRNIISRFSNVNKRTAPSEKRNDSRYIVIGNNKKLRLGTSTISRKDQHCIIRIFPAEEGDIVGTCRNVYVPLNTADEMLIQSRASSVQALSEIILQKYFNQNPDIKIAVGETKYKIGDKIKKRSIFITPKPNEIPPEGIVFIDTLIEDHLKPAYKQFNRYVYWQTDIKKEENGTYKITAQIMRNKNAELFPENDRILGKSWEFRAANEEAAKEFCKDIQRNIMRKEHFFSVNRPVDNFGASSMHLVARESLKEALASNKQIAFSNKIDGFLISNGLKIA